MGEVCVNGIGIWRYGFKEPIWIMTNLEPGDALALYEKRVKIEKCPDRCPNLSQKCAAPDARGAHPGPQAVACL